MKQTPLRRTTSLRRSWMRPWRRDDADKVTPAVHAYVLQRDRMCFAAMKDPEHRCRDRFGNPHASDDLTRMTLDHVHKAATMGVRAKSIPRCLVTMCGWANNEGWASAHRNDERIYLQEMEPDE